MPYGTRKPTGPWMMTMRLREEPRCPGCAEFLQPIVVEIRNGWAWCAICIGQKLHQQSHICFVMASDPMSACSTIVNGVRFYTPTPIAGNVLTAYEWYETSEMKVDLPVVPPGRDGVFALTPSGEHLLADLDTRELQKVEADTKRVRRRGGLD